MRKARASFIAPCGARTWHARRMATRGNQGTTGKRNANAKAKRKRAAAETRTPRDRRARVAPSVEREKAASAPENARLAEVDEVCAAWADIVAERIAADQTFADLVEQLGHVKTRDLRGLFLWDALRAAEAHVSLINEVLATHIEGRRADPIAILADLRARRLRLAAVYAVQAFLAVLNQMKPEKPRWLAMDDLDPRFAVLALAHQTLGYAVEAARVEAPPDLTEPILAAAQDETVWLWRRMPETGSDTLAACAAAAAFFRALGAAVMTTTDEVAGLYGEVGPTRRATG